jgi:hypothetical protein
VGVASRSHGRGVDEPEPVDADELEPADVDVPEPAGVDGPGEQAAVRDTRSIAKGKERMWTMLHLRPPVRGAKSSGAAARAIA